MSTDLHYIEELTRKYSKARGKLKERMGDLDAAVTVVRNRRLPGIHRAANEAKDCRWELEEAIRAQPELFVKPRTVTIDGVRVGMSKGKGSISWDDGDKVVALIEKHFPDQAEILIKTTNKPIKKALQNLTTAELKRIGCTVIDTGDEVVIKGQDSELEKLVDQLLEEQPLESDSV